MTDAVLPVHVAIIMDGNGRWAQAQNRERTYGHRRGVEMVREIVKASAECGIRMLTLFTFSSENWNRPRNEVQTLLQLFTSALGKYLDELIANEVRLRFIGSRTGLKAGLVKRIEEAEGATARLGRLQLNIALNYGGRRDIAEACLALNSADGGGEMEKRIADYLSTASVGDVDLMIRTGGEHRLSNFLLWQSAYAELYFTDTLWPEFDKGELLKALDWFAKRERRFGAVHAAG